MMQECSCGGLWIERERDGVVVYGFITWLFGISIDTKSELD